MNGPGYSRWAARVLESEAGLGTPPEGEARAASPITEADRQRAISLIELELVLQGRRSKRAQWALRLSVAASLVMGVGIAAWAASHGAAAKVALDTAPASLAPTAPAPATRAAAPAVDPASAVAVLQQQGPSPRPLTIVAHLTGTGASVSSPHAAVRDGESVHAGSHVVSHGASHAILAFSTGTELSVEDEGDMTVLGDGQSQIFALDAGAVRAHVAKLGAGERFVVHTPDAEVEVRGTSFRVSIAPADPTCGGGSVTRVAVDEGVVVVRQAGAEVRVGKGETWPAGCDVVPARSPSPASPSLRPSTTKGGRLAAASAMSSSGLAEQNDAFASALALKNTGRGSEAADAFEQFGRRYPSSNLAESAAVERMMLLLGTDRARGIAAAAQYLRRYPNGYAATDARAAVAGEGAR